MKLHYVGEVIVSDFGICKVIDVDDNNICTAETIITKEAFIEAFEKYIYNPTVITLKPLSNEETEKLIKTIQKQSLRCVETPHNEWIPVTYRPMTEEEEKELCLKWDIKEGSLEDWEKRVFTCPLPEDGQEILISTHWGVSEDVCTWDDGCIGLEDRGDWDGVDAWMPKPEPYKKEGAE